ncbi:MAG: biopolymer transporter ExbD [Planctomycetales bacterium]|nr:biopolymer transporter ExbD [Planctomycetales bacterium]
MAVTIKKGAALGALNLTPMIDIIFQLLIFFMVATRFSEEDREMDVELPTASEAKPLIVKPKEIFININLHGEVFVGGQRLDMVGLEEQLAAAARNNPANQSAIIRADKRTNLDSVVQVINACQRAGVSHSLTTDGD